MRRMNDAEFYQIDGEAVIITDDAGNELRRVPATPSLVADLERHADLFEAEADRAALLTAPLTPQPIEGTTVEEVKASAEASLADLATQMQDRLQLLAGG